MYLLHTTHIRSVSTETTAPYLILEVSNKFSPAAIRIELLVFILSDAPLLPDLYLGTEYPTF